MLPSSPLFEAPFTQQQQYATGSSSRGGAAAAGGGSLHQRGSRQESMPLQPGGASGTRSSVPLKRSRPRARTKGAWMKWGMRAVLVSPVVFLAFWSVAALVFSQSLQTTAESPQQSKMSAEESLLGVVEVMGEALGLPNNEKAGKMLPIIAPLGAVAPHPRPHPRQALIVEPPHTQQEAAAQAAQMASDQVASPVMQIASDQVASPLAQQEQQAPPAVQIASDQVVSPIVQQEPRPAALPMQQQKPIYVTPGVLMQPQPAATVAQPVTTMEGYMAVQQQQPAASVAQPVTASEGYMAAQQQQQQQQPPATVGQPVTTFEGYMEAQPAMQHAHLRGSNTHHGNVLTYYYDPRALKHDATGRLILPDTVYDAAGQPVSIHNLPQDAPVLFHEPPATVYHHDNYTNNPNITTINVTHTHPNTVETHRDYKRQATLSVDTTVPPSPWDSGLVVCTVAVVALLLGALSARSTRAAGWCLDVQDEVAYDAAYTVSGVSSSNNYATFADLEKFDV